jgi:hypothetical protein
MRYMKQSNWLNNRIPLAQLMKDVMKIKHRSDVQFVNSVYWKKEEDY